MSDNLWSVDPGKGIGPLKLGEPKEEVLRSLGEAGIELEDDDDDWLYVDDMDTELIFTKEQKPRLREIVVEDERLRFGPLKVIGERLHKIVDLLQVPPTETIWRINADDERDRPSGGNQTPEWTPSDEQLLDQGTLWVTSLGLGLGMVRGEITTVRLREPSGSPKRGLSHFTPTQRALSARADLPTYLLRTPGSARRRTSWFQLLIQVALFAALGLLVWKAINFQSRWNQAPAVEGDVIDVQPGAPDPFPSEFTVAYQDQAGGTHQVVFQRRDVYIAPKIGEKIEVRYLPEAPHQPLGPARYRDIAFERFVPWGIGLFTAYLALQLVAGALSWLTRYPSGKGGSSGTAISA